MRRIAFLALLALAGCATPYESPSLLTMGNGVTASRLDETTVRVTALGNAFTGSDTVERYMLRKASEETLAAGYIWFYPLAIEDRTRYSTVVSPGSSTSTTTANLQPWAGGYTGTAQTQTRTNAGSINTLRLPGRSVLVRMGSGPKPEGAFDAAEVLRFAFQ